MRIYDFKLRRDIEMAKHFLFFRQLPQCDQRALLKANALGMGVFDRLIELDVDSLAEYMEWVRFIDWLIDWLIYDSFKQLMVAVDKIWKRHRSEYEHVFRKSKTVISKFSTLNF